MSRTHDSGDPQLRPNKAELSDYDGGWNGVDMLSSPDRIEPGKCAFARNKRFRNLDAEPRLGIKEMTWASTDDVTDIFDAIAFSSVDDFEWVLRATADRVLISRPELESFIALPNGVTLDENTRMVQAFNRVYLFRGANADPLVWTPGSDPADPSDNAFAAVPSAQTHQNISRSYLAIWRNQRLWVAHDRDTVSPSQINDPTEYDPNDDLFIERGAHDSLVALYPFGKDIIVFKSESLYLLSDVTGSIDAVPVDELTRESGLKSPRAVTAFGRDVWYLSDTGVQSFSQVLDNKLQGEASAKSRPIQPLIDAINWQAASGIVATYWDGKYYLALPINGSSYNNIVAVYDTTYGTWQGFDQSEKHRIFRWIKMQYQGRLRLFFVDVEGALFLYEEDYEDSWGGEKHAIKDAFLSRGYLCDYADQKVFNEAHLAFGTQNPEIKVSTVVNGFH